MHVKFRYANLNDIFVIFSFFVTFLVILLLCSFFKIPDTLKSEEQVEMVRPGWLKER